MSYGIDEVEQLTPNPNPWIELTVLARRKIKTMRDLFAHVVRMTCTYTRLY